MREIFLQTITKHQGILHKVCGMYCDNKEDKEDLFQEIVAQLWKYYPKFRNESKVSTWMYRVAINTAITSFKKNKRRPDNSELNKEHIQLTYESVDEAFEERLQMLHSAISKLSDIEKSIILLFLEEKKYEEIAEIIGITQNNVRVKMNRIRGKLKQYMTGDE